MARKRCVGCQSSFEVEDFRRDNRTRDGLSKHCVDCLDAQIESTWAARRLAELKEDWTLATRLKVCTLCNASKPLIDFAANKNGRQGRNTHCRDCQSAKMRKWRAENPDRYARRGRGDWLRLKYGITLEEYDAMLERQGGGCAICGEVTTMKNGVKRLVVDHNHATGATRGILCIPCNTNLAGLERPGWVVSALEYLQSHHVSGTSLRPRDFDHILDNNATIPDLLNMVDEFVGGLSDAGGTIHSHSFEHTFESANGKDDQ